MDAHICVACGTQFAPSPAPPDSCPICNDDRQYAGRDGQQWTTLHELAGSHGNRIAPIEEGLHGICTEPKFAIGQRALLVQSPGGNLLWDCVSLLDDLTIREVRKLGGVETIAVSHPHFYSSAIEWAQAFDAEVVLHNGDREWLMRPHESVRFWNGAQERINGDLTLVHAGGHFPGSTVCHWVPGAGGRGALLTGDTIHVVGDRTRVSFMHSYPNLIPLPARKVRGIAAAVAALEFDRLYGAWWDSCVPTGAADIVQRSAERYVDAIAP